ncbi:hypothetical protein EIN_096210 [Entamoeba invadens IP1]|uniref:Uncharacterized protein n=1 Tax=Entamoeba invadens IP1 TaxID=370355 RepID=A0A0A1U0G3_ENTIV|nr:hypothetical protein EIN_096210 [Entamoeba invadens IP1]ELP87364.1 hypothetical protein EIN_096210 [Entamoeba invadens IP1]|eukprot:XP_004254135.1 hypothetical protein EIN_096210 [Entamoeba invadens IP1]
MATVFCNYFSALIRTGLLLISALSSTQILETVKNMKDKVKFKKLSSFQFVMTAPALETCQYEAVGKLLASVCLRIPSMLRDLFEAASGKPIQVCRNIHYISVWDTFSKYCISQNKTCQKFVEGINGVDNKWTLHFSAKLPLAYFFYCEYTTHLLKYFDHKSDQFSLIPGFSALSGLVEKISHGKTSKVSSEMHYEVQALLCTTEYPTTLNKILDDRMSHTNANSIDNLSNFVYSIQYVFKLMNKRKYVIDSVDTQRIVKVLDAIVLSDSYYAMTVMFSFLYELCPCLNKTKRHVVIDFVLKNFNHFFVHWYYQSRLDTYRFADCEFFI